MIILSYHLISKIVENPYTVAFNEFQNQLNWLRANGYQIVSLEDIDDLLIRNRANFVGIIFDDGYKNTIYTVLPYLKKLNITAAMAVSSGFVTKKVNKQLIPHVEKKLADIHEVEKWISSGMQICGHTYSHVNLTAITDKQKEWQIAYDQQNLEKIFNIKVKNFVYPYGKWNNRCLDIVGKYYNYAFATDNGNALSKKTPYCIRRMEVQSNWSLKDFIFMIEKEKKNEDSNVLA